MKTDLFPEGRKEGGNGACHIAGEVDVPMLEFHFEGEKQEKKKRKGRKRKKGGKTGKKEGGEGKRRGGRKKGGRG